jgi:hypothetical protein
MSSSPLRVSVSDRVLASFSVRGVIELYPLSRAAEALTGPLQQ